MTDVGGDEVAGLRWNCDRDAGTASEPPAAPTSRQNRSTDACQRETDARLHLVGFCFSDFSAKLLRLALLLYPKVTLRFGKRESQSDKYYLKVVVNAPWEKKSTAGRSCLDSFISVDDNMWHRRAETVRVLVSLGSLFSDAFTNICCWRWRVKRAQTFTLQWSVYNSVCNPLCDRCVSFTPVLRAVLVWSDHSGRMLILQNPDRNSSRQLTVVPTSF